MCNKWRYRSDRPAGDTAPGSILADFLWCVSRRSLVTGSQASGFWELFPHLPDPDSYRLTGDYVLLRFSSDGTAWELSTNSLPGGAKERSLSSTDVIYGLGIVGRDSWQPISTIYMSCTSPMTQQALQPLSPLQIPFVNWASSLLVCYRAHKELCFKNLVRHHECSAMV